jgi:hypothetical protein
MHTKEFRTLEVTMDVVGAPTVLADAPLVHIDRSYGSCRYTRSGKVWRVLECGHEKEMSPITMYRSRCWSCFAEQQCLFEMLEKKELHPEEARAVYAKGKKSKKPYYDYYLMSKLKYYIATNKDADWEKAEEEGKIKLVPRPIFDILFVED